MPAYSLPFLKIARLVETQHPGVEIQIALTPVDDLPPLTGEEKPHTNQNRLRDLRKEQQRPWNAGFSGWRRK
jgi:hypothetical protein